MIRDVLAVIIGLVLGNLAIMGLHSLGTVFYPLPKELDISNTLEIAKYIKKAPLGSMLFVMLAHLGGTFISGIFTTLISKNIIPIYIIGSFFTISGMYNLYILPHPLWFNIEILLYFPAAMYSHKLMNKLF